MFYINNQYNVFGLWPRLRPPQRTHTHADMCVSPRYRTNTQTNATRYCHPFRSGPRPHTHHSYTRQHTHCGCIFIFNVRTIYTHSIITLSHTHSTYHTHTHSISSAVHNTKLVRTANLQHTRTHTTTHTQTHTHNRSHAGR